MRTRRAILAFIVCSLLSVIPVVVAAQTAPAGPAPYVIRIPDRGTPEHAIDRVVIGVLTAFADGQSCASVDISRGTEVLRLGLSGQPEACGRDGALVTFARGDGKPLFVSFTLTRGATVELTNLAVQPPRSGSALTPGEVLPPKSGHGAVSAGARGDRWSIPLAGFLGLVAVVLAVASTRPGRRGKHFVKGDSV